MDRSLKWRTIALVFGLLLCAGLLAPTWPGADALPSWFPFKKQISLGLDLQGGLHIVYSIDLDKAVDDKASEIKRDLDARFGDEKIAAQVKTPAPRSAPSEIPLGAVIVTLPASLPAGKTKAEIESQIQTDNRGTIKPFDCPADAGASAICFNVSTEYAEGIKKAALTNAVTTIRDRINEKGVSEPSVVEKGDSIIVELPGDPEGAVMKETREIIARTAKLEFKVVDDSTECDAAGDAAVATLPSCFFKRLYQHVGSDAENKATDARAKALAIQAERYGWTPRDGGQKRSEHLLIAYDREEPMPVAWARKHGCKVPPGTGEGDKVPCAVTGRQALERYLFGDPVLQEAGVVGSEPGLKLPDDHQIGFEPREPDPLAKDQRTQWRTYYLDRSVRLTGSAIANAGASQDQNTGQPLVVLDFNRFGGRVFGDLTAQIVGRRLAAILDDKVRSAPQINEPIRGGRAQITLGGGDVQRQEREREELVNVLKTGSLPAPLREESASTLGATLGRDSIDKAKLSFLIGIALVVLIMVGVYRWSGWIAVFAVVFHIVMTLAVMAMFGATLTLPGVAAIVLSIGMEVDGNILIYERIRDELLLGKSVRGAVDLGFSRAFSAILDGQLTTAAAGWVLLQYGSGPIKGFAVMLLVGVFTTLSTNIWVTRIFFDWYIARKKGQLATISI
jgi:preprotein translocase subunit SecD